MAISTPSSHRPRLLPDHHRVLHMRRLWVMMAILAALVCAQPGPPQQQDITIDAETRTAVIDGVLDRLNRAYVFPEVAEKMGTAVRERLSKGEYDRITSSAELARALTEHLRA